MQDLCPSEHDEQARLMSMVRHCEERHPELKLLFAIPNGGLRKRATAGKLKAEGVKPGVPDLMLPARPSVSTGYPYHGLFVEMKRQNEKQSRPSADQKAWLAALEGQGYAVYVAYGWEQAWRIICWYLGIDHDSPFTDRAGRPLDGPLRLSPWPIIPVDTPGRDRGS